MTTSENQHEQIVYQHLTPTINQCSLTMAACANCAERSLESGLDCWKHCRGAAEITACLMRLVALNYANEKAIRSLINGANCVLRECQEHCSMHRNEHCEACARESGKLLEKLKVFQLTPASITSVIGM